MKIIATEKDELSDFAFQISTGFLPVLGVLDVVKKERSIWRKLTSVLL